LVVGIEFGEAARDARSFGEVAFAPAPADKVEGTVPEFPGAAGALEFFSETVEFVAVEFPGVGFFCVSKK